MPNKPQSTKTLRAKVQRSPAGEVLGICFMIGADSLSFVDSGTDWLQIKKRTTETGLIIELGCGET